MKKGFAASAVLAIAVTSVYVPEADCGVKLSTYRDPVHKFSLKRPSDWEQVPLEPTDVEKTAKFFEDSSRGDIFSTEMTVYKLLHGDAQAGPITGVGDLSEEQIRELLMAQRRSGQTMFDVTFKRLMNPLNTPLPDEEKDFKKIKSADKVPGKYYSLVMPFKPNDKGYAVHAMLATFLKDGVEYGVYMTTTQRRGEKLEKDFKKIMKSFLFFDKKAKDVEERDELADVDMSPKRRRKLEEGLIKGWDVEVSRKGQYVIIYNTKNGKNKSLAKEIAKKIEAIRAGVYEVQFPPAQPIESVSVVRVCADRKEYGAYGGPGGSAGYWNSWSQELVFYDASASKKIDDDTLSVLYHEAFHQYIYYSVGKVAPHSWFNEGHGDYYAGAQSKGSKFKIEPFDWRVSTVKNAVREGARPFEVKEDDKGKQRKIWANSGYTPLADLIHFSQREYYSYPGVSYAQGWAFIYFLREELSSKQKKIWGHILPTYFDTLKEAVNPTPVVEDVEDDEDPEPGDDDSGGGEEEEGGFSAPDPSKQFGEADEGALDKAVRVAFEGVDMEELEKAWVKFVKDL